MLDEVYREWVNPKFQENLDLILGLWHLHIQLFYPDRVYKILLKLKLDDGQEQVFDNDFEFIVKRK